MKDTLVLSQKMMKDHAMVGYTFLLPTARWP